jgi:hypothetical protein
VGLRLFGGAHLEVLTGVSLHGGEDESLLVLGELDVGDRRRRFLSSQGKLDPQVPVDDVPGRSNSLPRL